MIEFKRFHDLPSDTMVELLRQGYEFEPRFEQQWLEHWQAEERFFLEHLEIADSCGFVTTLDHQPIGFICWDPRKAPESVELGNNCIITGQKGNGYGKLQLQEAIRRIRELHVKRILVTTNERLSAAQKNYESVGFIFKQMRHNDWGGDYAGDFLDYELILEGNTMNITYSTDKDLPCEQLRDLFQAVGWSDGSETPEMLAYFNMPFLNSTVVISAWDGERLVGCIRALSDQIFRSVIYDLAVLPEYQGAGIGSQLLRQCQNTYPDSEWTVATIPERVSFYEKEGYQLETTPYLRVKSKWF